MSLDLDAIKARIADCSTYNFGMRNADQLAKEDAPALVKEVERLRGVVEEVKAFCSDPCTENCCEACNGQNEAYRQVLTILDALETE